MPIIIKLDGNGSGIRDAKTQALPPLCPVACDDELAAHTNLISATASRVQP